MSKIIARIASAALAIAAGPIVLAGPANAETVIRRVPVSDIDFSRASEVTRFNTRITRMAREICPADTRQNSAKAEACRQDLRGQAVARLGAMQRLQLARVEGAGLNLAAK